MPKTSVVAYNVGSPQNKFVFLIHFPNYIRREFNAVGPSSP